MPRPGRFTPGKETRYPLYRGLGGPQGQSERVAKISPPPGFDPRTVQPVASRCTDIAVSCQHSNSKSVDTLTQFFLECVNKEQMCKQGMATRGLPRPDTRLEILIHERKYKKKKSCKVVPVYVYGGVEV
jgi:hypothetical protein